MVIVPLKTKQVGHSVHMYFQCIQCQSTHLIKATTDEFDARFREHKLVQEAFPHHTAGERELMTSSMCGDCFDDLFAEPNDTE